MTTINNNWRQGNNDRRVNLAMTAEMALGGGSTLGQQKCSNFTNGGVVPRIRGDMKTGGTNDMLESYMPSQNTKPTQGGVVGGGNTYGFGSEKSGDNFGNWQQPSRAYNTGNDFGGVGAGFGGSSSNAYSTQQFSGNSNNTNNINNIMNGDSNGFKVQRVRGGGNAGTSSIPQQQQQSHPTGYGIGLNNIGQQANQGLGAGMQKGVNRKDENTDIDFQTRQIKKEIDSLDQKLSSKQHLGADQTFSPLGISKGGIGTTFGGQNNINTGNNALNGGFGNPNNQIHGSQGYGNNNNNFNNFYSSVDKTSIPFNGTPSTNSTVNSQTPSSGSGSTRQAQKPSSKEGFDDTLDFVKKPPANNSNNAFASTSMSSKHIPTEPNLAVAKEFSTGTYDPSNILGGSRQGRMRSLGKSKGQNSNQHEEKAAQATGTKLLPEQELISMEQFTCPEGCGRSFNKNALEKHIPYCKKLFQQKKPTEVATAAAVNKKPSNENDNTQQTAQKQQQLKPPKGKKEIKPAGDNPAKTEAIRKMKEQKKKEMEEMKRKESQKEGQHNASKNEEDGDMINDVHDGEYL